MRLTYILVILNVVFFIAQIAADVSVCNSLNGYPCNDEYSFDPVTETMALSPDEVVYKPWQFISYMFVHGDTLHIMINMFILLIFGIMVESALSEKRFLTIYFVSGIGSALLHLAVTPFVSPMGFSNILLGASGAIFGIVTAYGILFPKNIIYFFFFPMPARMAIIVIAGFELIVGLTGFLPGIANFGHLGGIVTGALIMWYWKKHERLIKPFGYRGYEFFWER